MRHFLLALGLVLLGLAACSQAPRTPPAPAPPAWRVAIVDTVDWDTAAGDAGRRLEARLDAARRDSADVVLFVLRHRARADTFDPLAAAIAGAAARRLRLHVAVDAAGLAPDALRAVVHHLAQHYEIAGLHLRGADAQAWVVAATAAWLVKPYLLLSTDPASTTAPPGPAAMGRLRLPAGVDVPLWRRGDSVPVEFDLGAEADVAASGQPWAAPIDSVTRVRTAIAADGRLALMLPSLPDTLRLQTPGGDTVHAWPTRFWKPPYRFALGADGDLMRAAPWVEARAQPPDTTTRAAFEVLGRTAPGATGHIDGIAAHVYPTGVFFDSVALAPGRNRVRWEARWPDGRHALYETETVRVEATQRPAFPPWLQGRGAEPRHNVTLTADDLIRISVRGAPGGTATARVGGVELTMLRTDGDGIATYEADLALARLRPGKPHRVEVRLRCERDGERADARLELPGTVEVRAAHAFPLLVTTRPENYLSESLGPVRLGGPFIAEYPAGVVLRADGRIGDQHRVRLGPTRVGYIPDRFVDPLPTGTPQPRYHLRSVVASVTDSTDVLRIPGEAVPWMVRSDPAARRIVVLLFGVEAASTWISHRVGLRVIDRVTWRQADADTYELSVELRDERIWGYDMAPDGSSLRLRLRHPPAADSASAAGPLAGLRVAIEAGHGGSNTGAIGLSGLLERDVNLATALALGRLCRAAGAEVLQLREDVTGVPYMARRDSVRAWGADVFLSIHANAAGGGFLTHDGTSTFYHDPFWKPLAARIYERLVGQLGLGEFGTVGSFNYRPTRMSSLPAVLVEQAFMTHAEDEALLASEAGRRAIAEQILAGLVDWVDWMRQGKRD